MPHKKSPDARNRSFQFTPQEYREILITAPIGICCSIPEGRFLDANPALARMLGYDSPQELVDSIEDIGRQIYADPEDRKTIIRFLEKQGEKIDFECRVIRRDGSRIWISNNIRAVKNEQGMISHYQSFISDITPLKENEQKLIEGERKYRLLMEQMTDTVWTLGLDMKPTYVSPSSARVLGFTPEERLRQHLSEMVTPETYARLMDIFAREKENARNGDMDPDRTLVVEMEYYHKDGHTMWLENKMRWILDDAGNIAGIHGVSRNITDRKKAEAALRERDDQFKKLALHVPGMIYQFMRRPDGSYSIPFATEGTLNTFGCSPEDVREDISLILERVLPEDRQKFIASIESSAQNLTPWRCEYRVRLPGQPVRWMLGHSTPEKLADGSIVWYGFNMDTTDRKRSDEELKKSLAQVRKALSATVHAMAATVEARDPYTAGHQRRVSDLARSLAKEMNLSRDQIEGIRTAASIHDLGKIPIPAEILSKPSKLTSIEFDLIKTHPQAGHDILKRINFPWPIARMVLEHHERLDGSGYPRGLRGDELLMESKILAVADVVEAMASHRPYRPAWSIDAALEDIIRNRGVHFDPEAVDVCVRLFHEKGYALQG